MNHELCIGEYEMHQECRLCKTQQSCKRKYEKLLIVIRKQIERDLPKRATAKSYQELQILEVKRQRVKDSLVKLNKLKRELREIKYNYTLGINELLGVKEEE